MDFETNGIPQENYGVSKNKSNPFSPTLWNDGKFDGNEEVITIEL